MRDPIRWGMVVVLISMFLLVSTTTERPISFGIESDKKKKVMTVFGAVRRWVYRRFYLSTSLVASIIKCFIYPEKFLHTTLHPWFGWKVAQARKNIPINKRIRMTKNEMRATGMQSVHSWVGFWIMEAWSMWILGSINPLYKPDRMHWKNQILKERAKIMTRMQKYFIETLGEKQGMAWAKSIHATTYYFSVTGNNANSGLTELLAKSALFNGVGGLNSIALLPGDICLFKCGDDFNPEDGTQWIDMDGIVGTALNPITFSSYSTGAKPILPTFLIGTGADKYMHFEHLEITGYDDAFTTENSGIYATYSTNGTGFYVEDCYIHPNSVGYMYIGVFSTAGSDNEIYDCEIEVTNAGVLFEADASGEGENNVVHDCEIYGDGGAIDNDGIVVHNNGGAFDMGAGWYIYDNIVHTFNENCIDDIGGDHSYIFRNVLYDADIVFCTDYNKEYVYLFQNFIQTPERFGVALLTPYNYVYNNIIEITNGANRTAAFFVYTSAGSFPDVEHLYIYYNTVTANAGLTAMIYFVGDAAWGTTANSIVIQNNIFATKTATGSNCIASAGAFALAIDSALLDINWNCWYQGSTAFSAWGHNWSDYQGHGHDTNGLNTDPLLVDVTQTDRDYNDYKLQAGSPCINAAVSIGSGTYYYYDVAETNSINTMTGIICDYLSYSRASDIGALEYGAGPLSVNFTITNITVRNITIKS